MRNTEEFPTFCPNHLCEYHLYPPREPYLVFQKVGRRDWYRCRFCRKKFRATIFALGYHGLLH
jgi:hypothetical protein